MMCASVAAGHYRRCARHTASIAEHGKFVLKIIVGWVDSTIVCPRGLVTAWAQKRAHPTCIDFKHNYLKNKLALDC